MKSDAIKRNKKSGFVALITAIIISVILLTVTVAMNQVGYLTRGEILDSEYKDRSTALAEACGDTALFKLAQDPTYQPPPGGDDIAVDSATCSIGSVQVDHPAAGQTTITTNAVFPATSVTNRGAVTKLQIVVDSTDLTLLSWNEIP